MKTAYFAGGCFWCTENDLKNISGVTSVFSGYIGKGNDADYYNHANFREGVEVAFDESKVTYKKLCQFFLDHIDPTDSGGQFFDRGESYKTAIYFGDDNEKEIAESLINELEESHLYDESIKVEILSFGSLNFVKAEDYHQKYAEKNPDHYYAYKNGSGRSEFQARVCAIRDEKKIVWKD